jgi:hypothetical protein
MPRVLKTKLHAFLHDYRKRVFELQHEHDQVDRRRQAAEEFVEEVLDQKFHYHFHKKVDPEQAETIQLIHNYCREAMFPPIMSRLTERVLLLEERHVAALDLVHRILDELAEDLELSSEQAESKAE